VSEAWKNFEKKSQN